MSILDMKKSLEFKVIVAVAGMLLLVAILSGLLAAAIQRATLLSITETNSETTALVVLEGIEATMMAAKAEITRESVNHLKKVKGVHEIHVVNHEGREAFQSNAPVREAALISEFKAGKERILERKGTFLTYSLPLKNVPGCQTCHGQDLPVLGAVKVTMSVEQEYAKAKKQIFLMVVGIIVVSLTFSLLLSYALRRLVIRPIKAIETAASRVAEGDISFNTDIASDDEIGRLSMLLKESSRSLGNIFHRIKDLSSRITRVTEDVEKESKNVVKGAEVETEGIINISHSVEELNATATEIAESTESLAASVEETSASIEQMVSSISTVNTNIHELSSAVESTSSSIEQLSATIRQVAAGSEELATASEETLSAISEITAAVKEVEEHAKESARQSERVTSEAANLGMTSIEKTVDGMKKIQSSVEHTAELIRKLGGRSDEIGKILTVIDDVTDQTTLLALNAAILAAQAGEHGKGFSVVAEEIKDLAERTAFSTQEIASLIQSVQKEVKDSADAMQGGLGAVSEGFKLAREADQALRKIVESSKISTDMAHSIERSTGEQAKATKLVTEGMERVRNMVDQVAKATAEQSRGSMLIIRATEKMRDISRQVSKATEEQSLSSKQISVVMDNVSERTQQISRSLTEHKVGSRNILNTVEGMKGIPVENRKLAFKVNTSLRDLHRDSELMCAEMERFRFYEEKGSVMKLGVLPLESPAIMYRKFAPLADYLGKKTGRKLELKVAVDFEDALKDLGQNVTQFCAMGPATYIEAQRRYGVKVLVKVLRDGKPFHHSVIVTREGADIRSVTDLKGRSFAFGNKHSTSGYLTPLLMLKEAGIEPNDLAYYHYLGYHDDVANAVLKGDFDAGAIIDSAAQKYLAQGLRIIQTSDAVPELNICANGFVDDKDASFIRTALISLSETTPEGRAVLQSIGEHYTGFAEASDSDYNSIRMKISKLGIQ